MFILKFIPDYDQELEPQFDRNSLESMFSTQMDFHIDRNVTSRLLGIQVSFLWRPRLNEVLKTDVHNWLCHPPHLIFIGIAIITKNHLTRYTK